MRLRVLHCTEHRAVRLSTVAPVLGHEDLQLLVERGDEDEARVWYFVAVFPLRVWHELHSPIDPLGERRRRAGNHAASTKPDLTGGWGHHSADVLTFFGGELLAPAAARPPGRQRRHRNVGSGQDQALVVRSG